MDDVREDFQVQHWEVADVSHCLPENFVFRVKRLVLPLALSPQDLEIIVLLQAARGEDPDQEKQDEEQCHPAREDVDARPRVQECLGSHVPLLKDLIPLVIHQRVAFLKHCSIGDGKEARRRLHGHVMRPSLRAGPAEEARRGLLLVPAPWHPRLFGQIYPKSLVCRCGNDGREDPNLLAEVLRLRRDGEVQEDPGHAERVGAPGRAAHLDAHFPVLPRPHDQAGRIDAAVRNLGASGQVHPFHDEADRVVAGIVLDQQRQVGRELHALRVGLGDDLRVQRRRGLVGDDLQEEVRVAGEPGVAVLRQPPDDDVLHADGQRVDAQGLAGQALQVPALQAGVAAAAVGADAPRPLPVAAAAALEEPPINHLEAVDPELVIPKTALENAPPVVDQSKATSDHQAQDDKLVKRLERLESKHMDPVIVSGCCLCCQPSSFPWGQRASVVAHIEHRGARHPST
mmetsp:Transcript_57555/g.168558  ORF Transcript_57555/g.168558 Transcript_57555/m.168558 type:complete len:457 (-) Transcript_57555:48-1418(-)